MTDLVQRALLVGAKGVSAVAWLEQERLAFEAWMKGHCWCVVGDWNGETYVHPDETAASFSPGAMDTRRLWAAWRDRAALARQDAPVAVALPSPGSQWLHKNGVVYTVLHVVNTQAAPGQNLEYPVMVVYQGADGRVWAKSVEGFLRSRTPWEAPVCAN